MSGFITKTPGSPLPPSTSQVQMTSPDAQAGLVKFASDSETELRNITRELAKQAKSSPFLPILSHCLSEVHVRLRENPPSEDRLFRLLVALERLASWPLSFETLKAPQARYQTSYPHLDCLAQQAAQGYQSAQACIKALAEDTQLKTYRTRKLFVRTFQAFAGTKRQLLDVEYRESSAHVPKDDTKKHLQEFGGSSQVLHSTQQAMEELELFGLEQDSSDPRLRFEADRFKSSLKYLHRTFGIGRKSRIKVCIIDTGIDFGHVDLRKHHEGRIMGYKAFSGGSALVDESGHGTHIAGIILELAPNVDLYIAKFTDSPQAVTPSASAKPAIFKAIQYARKFWKVNMISLSFGFRQTRAPDEIRGEIEKCLNEGIIIFACASNDSGHSPRTYPGNYDRVLCIHSATGGGNKSHFNPSEEPPGTKDNFSTVGECIGSYWPAAASGTTGQRYMSGTSFATPVAVAIAAFMVEYIEKMIPAHGWNIKPMSPEGMRKIFRLMSHKRDGYDWISPQWFFGKHMEDWIKHTIIEELDGYPKLEDK